MSLTIKQEEEKRRKYESFWNGFRCALSVVFFVGFIVAFIGSCIYEI